MFRNQHISITGFQIVDAEGTVDKKDRGSAIPAFATIAKEKDAGYANWQTMRPGDPANMMFWRLDPTGVPTRGAVVGSYSYAIPARRMASVPVVPPPPSGPITPGGPPAPTSGAGPGAPPPPPGKFLPLSVPGVLDADYEPLDIEEAGPEDWIILATVKHGDRRKLAFRPPNPIGFRLCADHRSDVAPDLSSIVHDGRPVKSLDDVRKAGLHTAWEVREWNAPGSQTNPYVGKYAPPPGGWKIGDKPERYSIAWVADAAPDWTGFARVGFGEKDGLFSHMQGGPFTTSVKQKHWLATTNDGDILAGALSTNSFFRGSDNPYSAPLDFEEKPYPNPMDSTYEYKVFLWYDHNKKHPFVAGTQPGMWRWFTRVPIGETPKCSPTKDDDYKKTSSQQAAATDNPKRSFAEDSRGIMHKKLITPGLYFTARPNLMMGKIPGTVTRYI